jgi:hypothetical protein
MLSAIAIPVPEAEALLRLAKKLPQGLLIHLHHEYTPPLLPPHPAPRFPSRPRIAACASSKFCFMFQGPGFVLLVTPNSSSRATHGAASALGARY